jgi:uncharacterized membrane protein YedE/YeeE
MTTTTMIIGTIFGIFFGYFVQRAGLCFSHGLAEIYMGKGKRIMKLFFVMFIISTLGFTFSGLIDPAMGLKTIGQLRGYGFYNLLSGIVFGAGILLCGGCILGTLRQLGEGNMFFLVVLISFIPGMSLVVFVLNPILKESYQINNLLIPTLLGVSPYILSVILALGSAWGLYIVSRKKVN